MAFMRGNFPGDGANWGMVPVMGHGGILPILPVSGSVEAGVNGIGGFGAGVHSDEERRVGIGGFVPAAFEAGELGQAKDGAF